MQLACLIFVFSCKNLLHANILANNTSNNTFKWQCYCPYQMVVCISETFGMSFLPRDKLLKLCLINLGSVEAGQKD